MREREIMCFVCVRVCVMEFRVSIHREDQGFRANVYKCNKMFFFMSLLITFKF
jgi:hypothetical protein